MMMLCLVILLAVGHVCAVEPGFKLRITNKGLNYAKDMMVRYLQESPNDFLPAQIEGVNNIAQWSLQNIRYKNFTVGDSSLRLNPRFLTLTLQDVAVESSMDGLLSRDALTANINSVNLTSLTLKVRLLSGLNHDGKLKLSLGNCQCTVGDIKMGYAGGSMQLFSVLTGAYTFDIKNLISKEVCSSLSKFVGQFNDLLPDMKWQDRKIIFDYSLTVGPQSTYSYMESWHKGEFISSSYAKYQFSPEHMSSTQPMPVPEPMPDFQEDDAMFYVLVNEYLFKSLMAALHENTPVLHVLGDADELSETYRNLLISVIKHYVTEDVLARTNVLVEVVADTTPNVELTSAGINVTLSGLWKLTLGDMHLNRYFTATRVFTPFILNNTLTIQSQQHRIKFGDHFTNLPESDVQLLTEGFESEFWSSFWVGDSESRTIGIIEPFVTLVNARIIFKDDLLVLATDFSLSSRTDPQAPPM